MDKLEFLGSASNDVTGSCTLLTADNGDQILIDFGMFQGTDETVKKNYGLLAFHPPALKGVFLTHAHLDHCGRLPLLIYGGYFGKIYMTSPTKSFVDLLLSDSARIVKFETKNKALYTIDQVQKTMQLVKEIEYDEQFTVGNFTVIYRDAGHILGSGSIEIIDNSGEKPTKYVFSGDLGNTPQDLVKPTQYINTADIVIMESTYGDSLHPDEDPKQIMQEEINAIEKSGGVLLIPAFAIERTQEVLHCIHHLKKEGRVLPGTPVYLDSPMGIDATSVYMNNDKYFNDEIHSHEDIPYNFEGLEVIYSGKESKQIIGQPAPKVIIAGSGMMSGGRIMQHALHYLSDKTTRILFVGYQAEETIGREILEGKQNVVIQDKQLFVRAHIREIKTMSSHADQRKLLNWLKQINDVKAVYLTHGEKNQREVLAERIQQELKIAKVILPEYNQEYFIE